MNPLFHKNSLNKLDDFISHPTNSVLISGPSGAGKGLTSLYLGSKILNIDLNKIHEYPYLMWLHDLDKGISIEKIRNIQTFMQLKTPGKSTYRRLLIIEQCDSMSLEAQNAFLKILEEPPSDSLIIMTASSSDSLLPTIKSRVQKININAPSLIQAKEYFSNQYSESEIVKAYYTSEGYIGLMSAILNKDISHPLLEYINSAKYVLSSNTYERLVKVEEISKQDINIFLQAMERVAHAALKQAIISEKSTSKNWTNKLKQILITKDLLKSNIQPKLLLTSLMLNL